MQRKYIFSLVITILLLGGCSSNEKKPVSDAEKTEVYRKLGVRYLALGMPEVALDKLARGLELDSNNPKLHNAIAVAYERLGKDQKARHHFKKSLALLPDDSDTLNNYGFFLCQRKEFKKGIFYLQQSVDNPVNNTRWQALTNLGLCVISQGNRDKAEIYFKKALLLQQAYSPALLEMAEIKYREANFMSARAYLERFNSAANGSMTAQSLLLGVKIERALGADDMAEQYRDRLLKNFPDSKQSEQLL